MADIHVHETLDRIDYISVFLYRLGFIISALLIAALGLAPWVDLPTLKLINLIAYSALLSACCVHLYDKTIRWLLLGASLFAMLWLQFEIWPQLALGASLVTLCGLSIKEYYCFRIQLIRITPLVLVGFWLSFALLPWLWLQLIFACLSSLLLMMIGIAKFKQPFDYDIGDKSKFQI
ncbi:MAG: DUF2301 domain-containing membrane protein [Vibrio sp.]